MKKRLAALLAAFCALALILSGCSLPAYSKEELENPKQTVRQFVDAMSSRDFASAEALVGNYATMGFDGMETAANSEIDSLLIDMLFESYKLEFISGDMSSITIPYESRDLKVSGKDAEISFLFTYLCFDNMLEDFSAVITEIGEDRMYYGEVYDTEEKALALAEEAFGKTFSADDMEKYYQTKEFTLTAHLTDDGWKLDMSEEFYSALLGR